MRRAGTMVAVALLAVLTSGCLVVTFPAGGPDPNRLSSSAAVVPNPSTEWMQVRVSVLNCHEFAGARLTATLLGTGWVIGGRRDARDAEVEVCAGNDGVFVQHVNWLTVEQSYDTNYTAAPAKPLEVRFHASDGTGDHGRFSGKAVLFDLSLVHCPGDTKAGPDGTRPTIPPCGDAGRQLT